MKVTIVGETSAESDTAVARWLERFLAQERPDTTWTVQPDESQRPTVLDDEHAA